MPSTNLVVQPIFPTPLGIGEIEGDPTLTLEEVKNLKNWDRGGGIGASGYNLLGSYPTLAKNILLAFDDYKFNLGLSEVEFSINSSWITETQPGAVGNYHRHYNSMFTGVYYPFPIENTTMEITKEGLDPSSFLIPGLEGSLYSTLSMSIEPAQHMLILMPSHLTHKIGKNNSIVNRYSVAFTFHPCGNIFTDGESSTFLFSKPFEG
jgi:hypothetical protein